MEPSDTIIIRETPTGKLHFSHKNHRFWKEIDGKKKYFPSVTGFTGILDKPGLPYWAVGLCEDELVLRLTNGKVLTEQDIYEAGVMHEIKKAEHADIGKTIHSWIDEWFTGKDPELPENSSVMSGVNSFLEFQNKYKFKWLEGEQIVCSDKYGFAGIYDKKMLLEKDTEIEGQMIPKGRYMTDFKSSNQLQDEFAFQTGLYQVAETEITGEEFMGRLVIRFAKESEDDYYARMAKKNEKRAKLGKKPVAIPPYKVFEPKFYLENEKDIEAALALITVKRRLTELAKLPTT